MDSDYEAAVAEAKEAAVAEAISLKQRELQLKALEQWAVVWQVRTSHYGVTFQEALSAAVP